LKIDYYGLKGDRGAFQLDLDQELAPEKAAANARAGLTVLVKVWLRTEGNVDLAGLEVKLAAAVGPLGLR
jgi:hypothetical protein